MFTRLNIKLIVLFFLAFWFLDKAGEILGYLRNPILVEQIRESKGEPSALANQGLTVIDTTDLLRATGLASLAGLLVGLIISLIICRRRQWHWINPALSFIIVYLTEWFQIEWTISIARFFRLPGELFTGIWYYLINGLLSVLIGISILIFINRMKRPNGHHHLAVSKSN